MNKTLRCLSTAALLSVCAGCSQVTSSVAGVNSVQGEAWYVRSVSIFLLTISTKAYYCPAPTGRGPVKCKEAIMHSDSGLTGQAGKGIVRGDSDADAEEEPEEDFEEEPAPKKRSKK